MTQSTVDKPPLTSRQVLTRFGVGAALLGILIIGAYFRLIGIGWGETFHLHPDERFMIQVSSGVSLPDSLAAYFDTTTSPLNPNNVGFGFYVYGNFPVTLVRAVGEAAGQTGYSNMHIVGRAVSATADLITLLLVFLIGRELFDRRYGLLGALLYAGAALPIQLSHYWTVDSMATTFVIAALWFAVRLYKQHRWHEYIIFGLFLGLAMASKVSTFPMAFVLMVALALRYLRTSSTPDVNPRPLLLRASAGLVLAGLVTVLVFRVAQPYAFLPPNTDLPIDGGGALAAVSRLAEPLGFRPNPAWLEQLEAASVGSSRSADAPPNHQWRNRLPLIFPLQNIIYPGMGVPFGVFAWLCVLWAGWEIARRHTGWMNLVLPLSWVLLIFVYEGVGWVKVMRYFAPIYPMLALLAAWGLLTMWQRVQALLQRKRIEGWHWAQVIPGVAAVVVILGALGWGWAVSRIYTRPLTRLEASRWIVENAPSDFTLTTRTASGQIEPVQAGLPNNWPVSPGEDSPTQPTISASVVGARQQRVVPLNVEQGATILSVDINRAFVPVATQSLHELQMALAADPTGQNRIAQGQLESEFAATADHPYGRSYTITFDAPVPVEDQLYLVVENQSADPIVFTGSIIAVEGAWDDPVPQAVDNTDVRGTYFHELKFEMAWEDTPDKRARMQHVLDSTDYITISSNRFYDSLSRNPLRWPMTLRYYDALFSGELGFRLVGDFTSRPNIGPVEFYDDEADEAWTVYDHPRVFIFEKTAAYDSQRTAAILNSVDLTTVVRQNAYDAEGQPVRIQRPDEYPAADFSMDPTAEAIPPMPSFFAQFGVTLVWWLTLAVLAVVSFPLLWVMFPGLPGRGCAVARVVGLLLVGWSAWLIASLGLLPWGRGLLFLMLLAVAAASTAVVWPQRRTFVAWLRDHRTHITLVEGVFAVLFVGFLLVRLANPDLWHPFYGGEKPMDLAYFNAVRQSDTFPPYDPWFVGGTINYYYFGFVLAAVPTMLLGLSTTLAYNLLIPTFFGLTGLGVFAVAHGLVGDDDDPTPDQTVSGGLVERVVGIANAIISRAAWVAGLLAILFALIFGNLDQIRRPLWALAELGAERSLWSFSLLPETDDVVRGLDLFLTDGRVLPINTGDWYWNATRLIPVPLENDRTTEIQPITEFPFFTFLYADLHAHMIAFPLTLFVMLWGVGVVRSVQTNDLRPGLNVPWLCALVVGAVGGGALIGTNTWDVPTYLVLGAGVLAFAVTVHSEERPAQIGLLVGGVLAAGMGLVAYTALANLGSDVGQLELAIAAAAAGVVFVIAYTVGLLLSSEKGTISLMAWWPAVKGLAWAALWGLLAIGSMLPYILNYRTEYTGFIPWSGSQTPIWAYLVMWGLPLFIIVTYLMVETLHTWRAEWLNRRTLVPMVAALLLIVAAVVIIGRQIPVARVALPVAIWMFALMLRPSIPARERLIGLFVIGGMLLTILVEVLVLRGDVGRMNTVFKFYLQVWFMLGISAAVCLVWVWQRLMNAPHLLRSGWAVGLGFLMALAALYPLTAAQAKMGDRWAPDAPVNLDGMVYMPYAERFEDGTTFPLEGDYRALRWMNANIEGTPIILEGHTTEYRWGGRVTVYTGYPAVIGWNWHQRQQRPWQSGEVFGRVNEVNRAYDSPLMEDAIRVLAKYDVDLIMVGELERAIYTPEGIAKFEEMERMGYLTTLFEHANTHIYLVEEDALP